MIPQGICGALRDLIPFVQFKKREKHPWRSVNFSNFWLPHFISAGCVRWGEFKFKKLIGLLNICILRFDFFFCIGRGGQSALRFARLRMEKRHNYVRKVAETAVQMFITNDKVALNILS